MNIFGRVIGLALAVGLVLFLLSLIVKVMLVGAGLFLLVRVAGRRLMGRAFGPLGRGGWQSSNIISIDNPGYRYGGNSSHFGRVIPVS